MKMSNKFMLVCCLLVINALACCFAFGANEIATSDSALATVPSAQRKTFYDTVNNVNWAFYYKNSAIEYSYSADGTTWAVGGTLNYDTSDFSLTYKVISSTPYVFVVHHGDTYDTLLSRGTLSASSISFDSAVSVFDGDADLDQYTGATINIDADNYIWVAAKYLAGNSMYQINVRRSTNIASAVLSSWEAASTLGMFQNTLGDLALTPLSGSDMMLICGNSSNNILAWRYSSGSWTEANATDSLGSRLFSSP